MEVVYDSMTGNVKRFVSKLPYESRSIRESVDSPFVLVTYTFNFGEVPKSTEAFLEKYHHLLVGVASSGNKTFGHNFARASAIISTKYQVPVLCNFEKSGTSKDIQIFIEGVDKLHEAYRIK